MAPTRFASWIGIGAQRAGTTWFTDLLLRHPAVGLAGDRKELHMFDSALGGGWDPSGAMVYKSLFTNDDGLRLGEFTPSYLRCPWVPDLLVNAAPEDAFFLVMLRDPIDRFESAMRWYLSRPSVPHGDKHAALATFMRLRGVDATWAGMYATQLEMWDRVAGRDRIHVVVYEETVGNPRAALAGVWAKLGLEPEDPGDPSAPSVTSTDRWTWSVDDIPGLRSQLSEIYRPEIERLSARIDLSAWPAGQ